MSDDPAIDSDSIETRPSHVDLANAFDTLWCPICGCESFHRVPCSGVNCNECHARVQVTPTAGDPGFVAHFYTRQHPFDSEKYGHRAPPEGYVFGKFSTSGLIYWHPSAPEQEDEEDYWHHSPERQPEQAAD